MKEFLIILSMVCVIEGAAYALFPKQMQEMMKKALLARPEQLRMWGLMLAVLGSVCAFLLKR